MRVLHIGKYYPPFNGGMENYMGDLLPALRDQAIEAVALVHQHRAGSSNQPFVHYAPCHGQFLYAPISPLFPSCFKRLLDDFNPDLLHLHLPNTSAFWALSFCKAKKIPWVIHWHADVIAESNKFLACAYKVYKPLESKLLAKSRAIIVTSPPYLKSSHTLKPWKDKCHIIPLARDSRKFSKLSQKHIQQATETWGKEKLKVLVVSRMSYYKGLEYLIQAISHLESVQLIIVGAGTRSKLNKYVHELAAEEQVLLADSQSVDRLHALMSSCDCLCLPSIDRSEAFGLVLLEAMYYAKPVIVSDIPGSGVGWVVLDGITGIHVPPKNAKRLALELYDLSNNKSKWLTMGETAKKRYHDSFDIHKSTSKIIELYESILNAQK